MGLAMVPRMCHQTSLSASTIGSTRQPARPASDFFSSDVRRTVRGSKACGAAAALRQRSSRVVAPAAAAASGDGSSNAGGGGGGGGGDGGDGSTTKNKSATVSPFAGKKISTLLASRGLSASGKPKPDSAPTAVDPPSAPPSAPTAAAAAVQTSLSSPSSKSASAIAALNAAASAAAKPSSPFATTASGSSPGSSPLASSSSPSAPTSPFAKSPLVASADAAPAAAAAPASPFGQAIARAASSSVNATPAAATRPTVSFRAKKSVIEALRQGEQDSKKAGAGTAAASGGRMGMGQPTAPSNIFNEPLRTQEQIEAEKWRFELSGAQILLVLSFFASSLLMMGTVYIVWKLGAIHFNEY